MATRKINRIVIHCSASETMVDIDAIRAFHVAKPPKGNGWKDIGYHMVIKKDGTIQFGRTENTIGAHCAGHNEDSLGICLAGLTQFTIPQLEAMRTLVRHLMEKHSIPIENVLGHYELDVHGKTCPNIPGVVLRAYCKV